MCSFVGQRFGALSCSCDAADIGLSPECFNWDGLELSCFHPQGFILETLQLLNMERGGPKLRRRSRVGKEAELQSFLGFHPLVISSPLTPLR